MIDFPRTTNSLAGYKDSTYQVQVFQRVLQKKPYFVSLEGTPLAEACSWREFIAWLNTEDSIGKKKPAEGFAKEAAEDVTAGEAQQVKEVPLVVEKSFRSHSAERYADNTGIKEKPTKQQSPNGPSWASQPFSTQPSWNFSDEQPITDDDEEEEDDEGDYEPPAVGH